MLKTLDIVLIALMLSGAAWTYKIKHDAQAIEIALNKVNKKITLEKETTKLLQADWSLLDQPDRLQRLVALYQDQLQLQPIQPDQIAKPDELPRRREEPAKVDTAHYADNSKTVVR